MEYQFSRDHLGLVNQRHQSVPYPSLVRTTHTRATIRRHPPISSKAASKTTIPICVDDVNEKAADAWEEVFIDAYNGSRRGTRTHGVEAFQTLPIVSANWSVGTDRQRAHTRSIHIAFQHHDNEPGANLLFAEMAEARVNASRSVGELIKLSKKFDHTDTKDIINRDICPCVIHILSQFDAPARFTTTMSIFVYFFLEVSIIQTRLHIVINTTYPYL